MCACATSSCRGIRCRLRLLSFAAVRAAAVEYDERREQAIADSRRGGVRLDVPTWAQLTASQKIDRVYRRVMKVTGQTDPRDTKDE